MFSLCLIFRCLSVKAVQAKWKNLRDYFRNEIKKITILKSGDSGNIATLFQELNVFKKIRLFLGTRSNLPEDNTISETDDSNLEENQSSRPQHDQLYDEHYHTQTELVDQSIPHLLLPQTSSGEWV